MMTERARWIVSLGGLVFAALVLASGFDRLSSHQPSDARLVPAAFRADAARVTASSHLLAGRHEGALAAARQSILADPFDPRGPAFLGAALYGQGANDEGERAMLLTARLSAREPLSQGALTAISMADGKVGEAARHFDILLRAHPRTRTLDGLFAIMESRPEGRAELARRLTRQSLWTDAYLRAEGQQVGVLRDRARFLAANADTISLGCDRIDPLVRELARRNYRADAQSLHSAQCASASSGQVLADSGFDRLGEDALFGWRRHGSGDVTISRRAGSVDLENRTSVTRLVLSQPIALPPGEYRAFGSVSGANSDALLASLNCGEPARPTQGGGSLGRGQLIRSDGCDDPVFGIWLRPGLGVVALDNVRLEAVGRAD